MTLTSSVFTHTHTSKPLPQVENQLQPRPVLEELDKTHQECQEIKSFAKAFLQEVTRSRPSIMKGEMFFKVTRFHSSFLNVLSQLQVRRLTPEMLKQTFPEFSNLVQADSVNEVCIL